MPLISDGNLLVLEACVLARNAHGRCLLDLFYYPPFLDPAVCRVFPLRNVGINWGRSPKVDVRHTEVLDPSHRSPSSPPMAHPPRRVPVPSVQEYAAVPQSQSPRNRRTSAQGGPPKSPSHMQAGRGAITRGVATGTIGAAYGPYSVRAYPCIVVIRDG
jgi:hypothetical protein